MNNKRYFYFMLILYIILALLFTVYVCISNNKIKTLQNDLNSTQEQVIELQENLEAYSDNYVAMWTTLNNAIAGELEDK